MSDDKFEVAFSGEVADGADIEQVKVKVGQMFKADAAKIEHLFSGKRVVIKKDIDQQTAAKYQLALNKVGAICEVNNLSTAISKPVSTPAEDLPPASGPAAVKSVTTESTMTQSGNLQATVPDIPVDIPDAPDTDPLHISADDIDDLPISIAPIGSDVQDEIKEMEEPVVDISGLDMAPVGSDMSDKKEEELPPQPDTTGLKIID